MKGAKLILLASSFFLLSGCSIEKESEAWRGQVQEAVDQLTTQMDRMTLAIPGERWLRLVDAAAGGDEAAREEAKQYIKRLFDVDIDAAYEATVVFGFDRDYGATVNADIFFDIVPGDAAVKRYCEDQITWQPKAVGDLIPKPRSPEELRSEILAEVRASFEILGTDVSRIYHSNNSTVFFYNRSSAFDLPHTAIKNLAGPITGSIQGRVSENDLEQVNRQTQAASALTDAILRLYTTKAWPENDGVITRPFPIGSNLPLLYVLVRESDLESHIADTTFKVHALVHKAEDRSATLNNQWAATFTYRHFSKEAIECGVTRDKVRWAAHNMTGAPVLTEDLLVKLGTLSKTLDAWDNYQRENDAD